MTAPAMTKGRLRGEICLGCCCIGAPGLVLVLVFVDLMDLVDIMDFMDTNKY